MYVYVQKADLGILSNDNNLEVLTGSNPHLLGKHSELTRNVTDSQIRY